MSSLHNKQTVIITGGCGCIAQHLTKELLLESESLSLDRIILLDVQQEWKPFWHLLENGDEDVNESVWRYPTKEMEKKVVFYQVDMCDERKLNETFEEIGRKYENLTSIFHVMSTIASWAPDYSFFEKINVQVTNQLLDLAFNSKTIKNFIYTSSGNVFYKTYSNEKFFTNEDEYQTITRNENNQIIDAKIEFPNNAPLEYGYIISKRKAHQSVIERPFKEKKQLFTIALSLCMTIYGEADMITRYVIEKESYNVKVGGLGHNLYAGNAAHAHVVAFKALNNHPEMIRGMTFMIHENNFGELAVHSTRGIMKCLTNDEKTYDGSQAKRIPTIVMLFLCYLFIFYNNFIYLLTRLKIKAEKYYTTPLVTRFTMDLTHYERYNDFNLANSSKYLSYSPKYKSEEAYEKVAIYIRKLEELGQLKTKLPPYQKKNQ